MANPNDLRVGVRVEYTGDITPEHLGKRGTIVSEATDTHGYRVNFDDGTSDQGLSNRSLTVLPHQTIDNITWYEGDRVAHTGKPGQMDGWHGTVVGFDGTHYVKVRFDDKFFNTYLSSTDNHSLLPADLTKLDPRASKPEPTTKEWTDAYNLLERLGTVTFTIRKAAFDPIDCGDINGGGDYRAVVHGDTIKVGCQRISFEKFDEIAAAVAKAREWQAIRDQTFSNDPAVQS